MLRYLMQIAIRNGISGFTAQALPDNKAMISVFNKSGCKVRSQFNGEVFSFEMDFA